MNGHRGTETQRLHALKWFAAPAFGRRYAG
jgi:hypothetical protein